MVALTDKALQEQLLTLGFAIVGKADGVAGPRTIQAIRDFQSYARMPRLARLKAVPPGGTRLIDRLEQVANPLPANRWPQINGARDDAPTLEALQFWIDNDLRCPLVVEVREYVETAREPRFEPTLDNVWLYDDPRINAYRERLLAGKEPELGRARKASFDFRACDFTGPAPPATHWDGLSRLGTRDFLFGHVGGKAIKRRDLEDAMEVTVLGATGQTFAGLGPQGLVFQAVRAVAEQECVGFFDSLNGYDNAFVSLGPCHWTLALGSGAAQRDAGELPALLAMAAGRDPDVQRSYLTPFGVGPKGVWANGAKGEDFDASFSATRNYVGYLAHLASPADPIRSVRELRWFATTHWFSRWMRLARGSAAFRRAQFDMARMRLRDVLQAPLGGTGPYRNNKIGELFKSQLSAALLLRLHVRYSGATDPTSRAWIGRAVALAEVTGPPSGWGQGQEDRLIEGLIAHSIRKSHTLKLLKLDGLGREPRRGELIAALPNVPKNETSPLPASMQAVAAWPDPELFRARRYNLEAAAWKDSGVRTPLKRDRATFATAYRDLVADPTLPPPAD